MSSLDDLTTRNGVVTTKRREECVIRFKALCQASIDDQLELFLKTFIFVLGDGWKAVNKLSNDFQKYCRDGGEGRMDLNPVQASDFLQKYGLTRTASQRTAELKDVDLNSDGRISFIEYLLLHYKSMVLNEFYKRIEMDPVEDLSDGAIGVCGVGDKLLDQLFTLPVGMDPETEKAIEEFTQIKRERAEKILALQEKADAGGVKGMAAKNEIIQMELEDPTSMNRLELSLNAAKRRAAKSSGEVALKHKKVEDEKLAKQKAAESQARLRERAARFEGTQ